MPRLSFGMSDEVAEEAILCASADLSHDELLPNAIIQDSNDTDVKNHYHHHYEKEGFHLIHEASMLLSIALPNVAVQFSVLFIFPLTASAVGLRFGTEELAGFSLGSLVGNLTCLSVMVGALTAADTLMPRALSMGRYAELGKLAIRGLVMCSILLIPPIIPLCTIMEQIFDALGQDPIASSLASKWVKVYLLGVPAMLLFRCMQSFLNAQHQVWPLVVGSTTSCFIIHPILLKIFLPLLGFLGSSAALSLTQYVMAAIVFLYLVIKPVHKPETWPGLSLEYIKGSLAPEPLLQFLSLSMGGVLSLSVS